jgi:hypothetical protein
VLPCKINGKLLFSLCTTCAETYQHTKCLQTNEERAFIGTWDTDEVKKAIDKGYILDSIYEVWHFENISQYDPNTKEGGLFTEYVNTFLKFKQERVVGQNGVLLKNKTKSYTFNSIIKKRGYISTAIT